MTTALPEHMEARWRSASRIAQGLLVRLPNGTKPVRCRAGGVIFTLRRTGATRERLGVDGFYTEFFPKDTIVTATVGNWSITRRIRASFETDRFLRLCRFMYYAATEEQMRQDAMLQADSADTVVHEHVYRAA